MTSHTEKLIDGFNGVSSQGTLFVKCLSLSYTIPCRIPLISSGIATILKRRSQYKSQLEKINCQIQDYMKLLKALRSKLNTQIKQNDHKLAHISEHPMYHLFQIQTESLISNVLSDKIFIDSLSEKISEDMPAPELAKSMAIEIEGTPMLTEQDFQEKLSKTALLKSLVALNDHESPSYHSNLINAAQTGNLSHFIQTLISQEKQKTADLQAENNALETDNVLLKQAKTTVNQQLRQFRKQLKSLHLPQAGYSVVELMKKEYHIAEFILRSRQCLIDCLSATQLELNGKLDLAPIITLNSSVF